MGKFSKKPLGQKISDIALTVFLISVVLGAVSFFMPPLGIISNWMLFLGIAALSAFVVSTIITINDDNYSNNKNCGNCK